MELLPLSVVQAVDVWETKFSCKVSLGGMFVFSARFMRVLNASSSSDQFLCRASRLLKCVVLRTWQMCKRTVLCAVYVLCFNR